MYSRPRNRQGPRTSDIVAWPAPTGGLIANRNLATPEGAPAAKMLENWFPTATGITIRRGSQLYSTVGGGTPDVEEMWTYISGNSEKFFAATTTNIYDITVPGTPVSVASGKTSGDWVAQQFTTSGGTFLIAVNGHDPALIYDGTTWAATGITGVDTSKLSYVWIYKNRLFFVERNSLNAWYLAVDSIAGPATVFPLGGVFSLGGSLLFGSAWSIESADGLDSRCIFVTGNESNSIGNMGEVAVYAGIDPSDPNQWGLIGVYRSGMPMGRKAHIRAGGDVIIATDLGFVPLSVAIQRDVAALAPSSLSFSIEDEWAIEVERRSSVEWKCMTWPTGRMTVVMLPTLGYLPKWFVGNVRTGAWCVFSGWNARCLTVYQDRLFFGSNNGRVIEAMVTGMDEYAIYPTPRAPYTATVVPLFQSLQSATAGKIPNLARAVMRAAVEVRPTIKMQYEFKIALQPAPAATPVPVGALWGSGTWGTSIWGGGDVNPTTYKEWKSMDGKGDDISPALRLTSGAVQPLDAELVRIEANVIVEPGAVI